MADYSPEVKKILRDHSCYSIRPGKGDHEIWYSPSKKRSFPVDSKILSRYTATVIGLGAGISSRS